eukprot:1340-Heterococcus_DN1.PRE.8
MPVPGPQNLCNGNTPSLPCIHSLYVVYTTAAVSTCYEEHCGAAILSIARAMRVTITVHCKWERWRSASVASRRLRQLSNMHTAGRAVNCVEQYRAQCNKYGNRWRHTLCTNGTAKVLFTYASNFEAAHAFAQQPAWEGRVYATKLDQVRPPLSINILSCMLICAKLGHTTQIVCINKCSSSLLLKAGGKAGATPASLQRCTYST